MRVSEVQRRHRQNTYADKQACGCNAGWRVVGGTWKIRCAPSVQVGEAAVLRGKREQGIWPYLINNTQRPPSHLHKVLIA